MTDLTPTTPAAVTYPRLPMNTEPTKPMNIFHLLRQLRLYALAQRLVPFPLPASERELRRWDALGEAYTALLEIKYADNLQAARELAASSADRVRESCRQRRQGANIPGGRNP